MSKKEQIIALYEKGAKPKDIAKEVDSWVANVYEVISAYKKDKELAELRLKINK